MSILNSIHPQMVLSCGFAGGLNPQWCLGDVIYHTDGDPDFERKLTLAGAKPGRFLHVDQVIWKSETKISLWQSTQADGVDMESQIIREHCFASGIPSVTLRAISDTATKDLPIDFNHFLYPDGKPRWLRLTKALLRNPSLAGRLMRLHKGCQLAATKLADVLNTVLLP